MLILYGIHNGVEKPRSLAKLYEVKQEDRECSLAFYEWLCEVAHKWTDLDLESDGNWMLLNMVLIGQLALDIRNLFGKKKFIHLPLVGVISVLFKCVFGLALACRMCYSKCNISLSVLILSSLGLASSWFF